MTYTVAIAGLGAIGVRVARAIDNQQIVGMKLVCVSAHNHARARDRVADFRSPPPVVDLQVLGENADIVVECVPAANFRLVAQPAVSAGRIFMPLSVGALLENTDLVDVSKANGGRIIVPTGALVGLDTVRAMAVGEIHDVRLETRKPPAGLAGAPYLDEQEIVLDKIAEPVRVFQGTARQAAKAFPANVNVAAALALAGIGADRTKVEVWADPDIDRNRQTVSITSDAGEATMTMSNIPSDENPRTGRIVANSVIATLARLTATLSSGT